MPRRRIQIITGWNAHASISAITSGIVTSGSCWMPQMMPAATATTRMICSARTPSLPNPSAHRLHGALVAFSSRSCDTSCTFCGSFRNIFILQVSSGGAGNDRAPPGAGDHWASLING